jgi:hypothetical protein
LNFRIPHPAHPRSHRAETGYNHKNRWQNRLRICATSAIH